MAEIVTLDSLALAVEPWDWPFARMRRADIDAHFADRLARTPQLWNGRMMMTRRCGIADGVLSGECFETDFASFLAWREWGCPDNSVTNCFSMGAIRAADGAFLLGVMGGHTASPGRIYFPAGTPDPEDVIDGRLDLDASVLREVAEETGLMTGDFQVRPGWQAVVDGPRIALMKEFDARDTAEVLRARILRQLAREQQPELADIWIVRSRADFDPAMPYFVTAYLDHML
jgi:xanthine/CO dehydrogenase XdhC/CoxF family maturation factor